MHVDRDSNSSGASQGADAPHCQIKGRGLSVMLAAWPVAKLTYHRCGYCFLLSLLLIIAGDVKKTNEKSNNAKQGSSS